MVNEVYIVAAKRTPIGSFMGKLSGIPATSLGATAIKGALESCQMAPQLVQEVFMGNVLSAGLGQAPARQASMFAGIPDQVPCTTVNKVCASGMKAIMLAAQSIILGDRDIVVAGGMESMSRVPHYLEKLRQGHKLGNQQLTDGLILDGLTDVYNHYHMGNAAELCARECHISREEQDDYTISSYERAANAWKNGKFSDEITPVDIAQRNNSSITVAEDEEYRNIVKEKIPGLKPVFQRDGTVTAANASTLNDGAAAVVLVSADAVKKHKLKPLARILSYADAAQAPEWFTTAPSLALPFAIEKAGLNSTDIDYYEINEAFAVVSLANMNTLGLTPQNVNVNGGAVALGHPLGCSGARIIVTLMNVLRQNNAKTGAAGICNGGGGASAMVLEAIA